MAGDHIDVTVSFKFVDNLNQVVQRLKSVASQVRPGMAGAAEFGAATSAAAEKARQIKTAQGLPRSELAETLKQLRAVATQTVRREARREGVGAGQYRAGMEAGGYTRAGMTLGPPKTYGDKIEAAVASATKRQVKRADIQAGLAGEDRYISATAALTTARKEQAAKVAAIQNADSAYQEWTLKLATERQWKAAQEAAAQRSDPDYQAATLLLARERQQKAAQELGARNADPDYQAATLALARERQQKAAQELAAQNADPQFQSSTLALARERQTKAAQELAAQNADPQYQSATLALARGRQTRAVQELAAKNADPEYQKATLQLARERQTKAVQELAARSADPEYQKQTLQLARERQRKAAQELGARNADPEYQNWTMQLARARQSKAVQELAARNADPEYQTATLALARERQIKTAQEAAATATDAQYIEASALAARAKQEQAARVTLAAAGERYQGRGRQELLASAALAQRTQADLQAATVARLSMRSNQAAVSATVERRIAESALAAELRRREREELRARIKAGEAGGTRFQQMQAMFSPTGRPPGAYPTLGQTVGQKTVTSAGYAVGGALVGAALFGTIAAVKEASKLQEQFAGLRGQMDAIGQSSAFVDVRNRLKQISSETGVATSEVAKFAARLLGVFNDPNRALEETESAMKLAVVSGTDLATMIEELVPIAQAFGVGIEDIGDLAVSMHDKFGIAEESILHFLGEVAPLADEAGLSMSDMGVIGATAANSIGKSINVAAEQFSKVLPTMQQNQDKIFAILRQNPETAGFVKPVVEAFGRGESGDALKILLEAYGKLDGVQQQNLIRVSANRREWALLAGIFGNSAKLLQDLREAETGAAQTAGGLERRFEAVSATLSRSVERIQESFKNIVEGVLSSGIGDALTVVGKGLESVIGLVSLLFGAFSKLNEVTKLPGLEAGLLATIVQLGVSFAVASLAYSKFNAVRSGSGRTSIALARNEEGLSLAIQRRSAASVEGEASLAADAAGKEADAAATQQATAAEGELTAARAAATTAAGTEATATEAAAAARMAPGAGQLGLFPLAGIPRAPAAAAPAVTAGEAGQLALFGANVGRPPPPAAPTGLSGQIARSRFLTRALSGGRFLNVGTANAAAEGAGIASGATLLPVAGMVAVGALMVKNARDEWSDKLNQSSDELRERLKKASTGNLEEISRQHGDIWDSIQEKIFGVDLPATLGQKETARRAGAGGAQAIGVMQSRRMIDTFAKNVSEERLKQINDYLNRTDETKQLGIALGAQKGGILTKAAGLASTLTGTKLPFGIGQDVEVSRENLKDLLPQIKQKAEEGDASAAELSKMIEAEIQQNKSMSEIKGAVDDAIKAGDLAKAIDEAGGIEEFLKLRGLYDPEGQLQTGQITRGEYISAVRQKVDDLQAQLKGAPDRTKAQEEFDKQLAKLQQVQDQINQERLEQIKMMAPITSLRPKAEILAATLKALPAMSLPTQISKIPELIQGRWDTFQEHLGTIQNPDELFAQASRGVQIDPQTRVLSVIKNIQDSPKLMDLVKQARPPTMELDAFIRTIAEERVNTGKSMRQILQEYEAKKFPQRAGEPPAAEAQKFASDLGSLTDADIAQLEQDVVDLKQPPELLDKVRTEQTTTIRAANIALRASTQGTSPYVAAQAELETAQAELEKLLHLKGIQQGGPTIDADIANAQARVNKALAASREVVYSTEQAMEQWAVVFAHGDPVRETEARLASAINDVERIRAENQGDERDPKLIQARQAVVSLQLTQIDNMNEITRANMELAAFERSLDPEAAAEDALSAAQFALQIAHGDVQRAQALLQIKQAQRQSEEAAQEALRANQELEAFDRNRDPQQAAEDQVRAAQLAVEQAQGRGRSAMFAALLSLKQAQRTREEAASAAIGAEAELAITLANVAQQPVLAAQLAVREAERKLQEAQAQGLGRATIAQLTGDLAEKRMAAIDATVAESEDMINYLLEMGQITQSEAIARLRVEQGRYEVNSKKWRDLQLKIHQLEQAAAQDLQFNLPTMLGLPTLYEARRVDQGTRAGIGYQDNRSIALTVMVNGAQDPMAVTNQVMSAFQSAMNMGVTYTPQVGVGT